MAREFVLVPKAKYESLLKSFTSQSEQPSNTLSDQTGGGDKATKVEDEKDEMSNLCHLKKK